MHVPLPARLQEIFTEQGSLVIRFKAVRDVSDAQTWVCGHCHERQHCIEQCLVCGTKRPAVAHTADASLFGRFAQEVAGASVVCPGLIEDIEAALEGSDDMVVAFVGSMARGGEYWDVWASGPTSQSASQLKPDRKGIGPLKRIQFLPASTGTRTARWPALHAGLPYSPMYMKAIVIIIYRTHDRSCH